MWSLWIIYFVAYINVFHCLPLFPCIPGQWLAPSESFWDHWHICNSNPQMGLDIRPVWSGEISSSLGHIPLLDKPNTIQYHIVEYIKWNKYINKYIYIFIYIIYFCAKYLAIYPPSYDLCHPIDIKSRKRPNDHGTEWSSSARPESASGARQFLTVTDIAVVKQWFSGTATTRTTTTTTMQLHYTNYTARHYTPLDYTTLHYTTLNYTTLNYKYNFN